MESESEKPTVIIGHFDAHGVLTTAARARTIKAIHKVFSSYPHTGPEKLADFIDTYFPTLKENKVEIIDIPVNERDPSTYIEAVNRLSRNTDVTIYDHHKSDIKYATMITARMIIFPNAVEMANTLTNNENRELAYIGVVADRDQSILDVLSNEEVEKIMPLANTADILVRDPNVGPQKLVDTLITDANPVELLRKLSAEKKYPPVEIANKITDVRKGYRTVLVDLTKLDDSTKAQLQAWIFKTMEAIAQKHRVDYVVAIAEAKDRQTNRVVPTVQVIRYWLSDAVAPKKLVNTGGLTVIGHEDAFSIRALDIDNARMLATNIFNDLELASPRTTRLINEQVVAQAVESDFRTLINKISQIAEQQAQLQKEIKEVKTEQEEIKKFLEMEKRRPTLLSKATE